MRVLNKNSKSIWSTKASMFRAYKEELMRPKRISRLNQAKMIKILRKVAQAPIALSESYKLISACNRNPKMTFTSYSLQNKFLAARQAKSTQFFKSGLKHQIWTLCQCHTKCVTKADKILWNIWRTETSTSLNTSNKIRMKSQWMVPKICKV